MPPGLFSVLSLLPTNIGCPHPDVPELSQKTEMLLIGEFDWTLVSRDFIPESGQNLLSCGVGYAFW